MSKIDELIERYLTESIDCPKCGKPPKAVITQEDSKTGETVVYCNKHKDTELFRTKDMNKLGKFMRELW